MIKVGIIGVTGYAGIQLLWILRQHKQVKIELLSSRSYQNMNIDEVYPNFKTGLTQKLLSDEAFMEQIHCIDLLFMSLPHGLSQKFALKAVEMGVKVIDLGADFRFDDVHKYEHYYGAQHEAKALNQMAVYGLPELYRHQIIGANVVASPGCYPTSAILGIAPLLKHHWVDPKEIIIDAKSGTTGAGRSETVPNLFCEVNESFKAYGLFSHRHRPEIEEKLSSIANEEVEIIFTPHLLPINRGIFSTIYLNLLTEKSKAELYELFYHFYDNERFVRISDALPEIKHVAHSNFCDIAIRVEKNRVIVTAVIDNLIKGAAGQAVQSMNIMLGFDEAEGLDFFPMYL